MFTKTQIEQIIEIIHQHFGAVSFLVTGVLPDGLDIQALKDKGILASDVPENLIKDAYTYGVLSAHTTIMWLRL